MEKCFRKADPDKIEYRAVEKLQLHYSKENGNEPETIYVLEPIRSGFDIADQGTGRIAVLELEFYDIFCEVEE